jgi:hypothetical protein
VIGFRPLQCLFGILLFLSACFLIRDSDHFILGTIDVLVALHVLWTCLVFIPVQRK